MPDETKVEGDGGESKSDAFDPQTLGKEAQEYIRKQVQSESDSKAALVEKRLQDDQAQRNRSAVDTAQRNELSQLATSGQHEALGVRVAAMMTDQDARASAIGDASNAIERQMSDAFVKTLGPDKVEEVRQKVISEGGAHAEFALGLAKAADSDARATQIKDEVQAALTAAGVAKRDETAGGSEGAKGGQGTQLQGFDAIQKAYIAGTLGPNAAQNRKVYEEALAARGK